jgi:hypothetical protein
MSAGNNIVITLVGRTGDGKSTTGNEILRRLENNTKPFDEGNTAYAHTRASRYVVEKNFMIVDNPGLMDANSPDADKKNITDIVKVANSLGHINMIVLVLNAKAVRFDAGMQNALKLISDSFGPASLSHLFVVYTNRFGSPDNLLQARTNDILHIINARCGTALNHLTYYAVENYPEAFQPDISDEVVARLHAESWTRLDELLLAAQAQAPYVTGNLQAAEYDFERETRQAKESAARSQKETEESRQREQQLRQQLGEAKKKRGFNLAGALIGYVVAGPLGIAVGANI